MSSQGTSETNLNFIYTKNNFEKQNEVVYWGINICGDFLQV